MRATMSILAAGLLAGCLLGGYARAQTSGPEPANDRQTPEKQASDKAAAEKKPAAGGFRLFKDGAGFMVLDGRILIELMVIHQDVVEPGIFFLDVGAGELCAIESGFAEKLKLSENGTLTIKLGQDIALDGVTPVPVEGEECRRFSKSQAAVLQGRPVSGILGYPALDGNKVELDFSEYRLRLPAPAEGGQLEQAASSPEAVGNGSSPILDIPYRLDPVPLTCDASINETEGFVFRISTSSPSWIRREKASSARWRKGTAPASLQVAGAEISALPIEFEFVSLEDPEAPGPDGVLGCDFLAFFNVTIDTANRIVQLRPIQPPSPK